MIELRSGKQDVLQLEHVPLHSRVVSDGRRDKGCPIFAAAGNEDSTVMFPATSKHAIAVGASTHREKRAHYSNHGRTLPIVAPSGGVIVRPSNSPRPAPGMIISTDLSSPRRGFNLGSFNAGGAGGLFYSKWAGTSSSAPLCAGIAALLLSANPSLTRNEARSVLEQTAEKIGPKKSYDAKGHNQNFGFRRVNATRAVTPALQLAGKRSRKRR